MYEYFFLWLLFYFNLVIDLSVNQPFACSMENHHCPIHILFYFIHVTSNMDIPVKWKHIIHLQIFRVQSCYKAVETEVFSCQFWWWQMQKLWYDLIVAINGSLFHSISRTIEWNIISCGLRRWILMWFCEIPLLTILKCHRF